MHAHNFEDLSGLIFGDFEVINEAPPQIRPNGKKNIMWHVRCTNCGFEKDVAANHIKRRPNVCTNCHIKKTTFEDLTGKVFGFIKVIDRAPSVLKGNGKMRTMWNCICLICGREFTMSASLLKSGKQISCGCLGNLLKSKSKLNDYTGKQVGRLSVKKRIEDYIKPSGGKEAQWLCICICEQECIKTSTYLRTSPCPSCGCWKSEITSELKSKDLVGQVFGEILVLKRLYTRKTKGGNPKIIYLAKCLNCGTVFEVAAGNLLSGNTRSCGCVKSFGELETRKELQKRKIKYKTQYTFKDLYVTSPDYPLEFDFGILDKNGNLEFLIEYQGKQHYEETDKKGLFGKQQRELTDILKKEYCSAHNIALYEIRYDEDISEALDKILTIHVNSVPSSE